ncbi:MAG: outer membrane lipoprotein chaperone LolA [Pseudomonadota bacterium]
MFRVFLAVILLSVSSLSPAATDAAASLVKLLGAVNSMQATFTQQTVDAKGRAQPLQSGTMSVKRPGLFRWEVQKPAPQLVMTTGKVLWIYDPELMQATKQKLDEQVGNTPALLLSGDPRQLGEAFAIAEEKGSADKVFVLQPQGKDALFEYLRVRFQGSKLIEMELADTMSQRTVIRFGDIRVNPALGAQHFEFVPPRGVDVIDQL